MPLMMRTKKGLVVAGIMLLATTAAQAGPKYYFELRDVKSDVEVDAALKQYAGETLTDEFKARPEFTADLGGAKGDAIAAEAKRRNLAAYQISLKIEKLTKEVKEPKPGGRLKRLQMGIKVAVFGTTLPGEKLAFSGDGEAAIESEVAERGMDREAVSLFRDVAKEAIKQAVDQAVAKLGAPKSAPVNEKKRGKNKKKKK